MIAMVTGGARSGKSAFAEKYAARLAERGIYVATAQALDESMRERIARHRRRRDDMEFRWQTVEEPLDLVGVLTRTEREPVVLIDCLTLWLTNVLLQAGSGGDGGGWTGSERTASERTGGERTGGAGPEPGGRSGGETVRAGEAAGRPAEEEAVSRRVLGRVDELAGALSAHRGHVVLVTNEVGDGIVPEYPLGRLYRDLAGLMNQRIAAVSGQVFLVTAGIPIELKSLAYRWPDERT